MSGGIGDSVGVRDAKGELLISKTMVSNGGIKGDIILIEVGTEERSFDALNNNSAADLYLAWKCLR